MEVQKRTGLVEGDRSDGDSQRRRARLHVRFGVQCSARRAGTEARAGGEAGEEAPRRGEGVGVGALPEARLTRRRGGRRESPARGCCGCAGSGWCTQAGSGRGQAQAGEASEASDQQPEGRERGGPSPRRSVFALARDRAPTTRPSHRSRQHSCASLHLLATAALLCLASRSSLRPCSSILARLRSSVPRVFASSSIPLASSPSARPLRRLCSNKQHLRPSLQAKVLSPKVLASELPRVELAWHSTPRGLRSLFFGRPLVEIDRWARAQWQCELSGPRTPRISSLPRFDLA